MKKDEIKEIVIPLKREIENKEKTISFYGRSSTLMEFLEGLFITIVILMVTAFIIASAFLL